MKLMQFMNEVIHSTVNATLVDTRDNILYEGEIGNCPAKYIKCEVARFAGFSSDVIIKVEYRG